MRLLAVTLPPLTGLSILMRLLAVTLPPLTGLSIFVQSNQSGVEGCEEPNQ